MRLQVVVRYTGFVLLVSAFLMFLSAIVSLCYQADSSFSPLLLSTFICATVGIFPLVFVPAPTEISTKEGYVIVFLAWIATCTFGMLPYLLWGGEFTFINAWFESVSGFSGTGATILTDVEAIPHGLLFWRSCTHWLGGIGIIICMLLILPTMRNLKQRLAKLEMSSLSKSSFKFRTQQTIRIITWVYLTLTFVTTILLWLAGMNLFDAVNHAFSTISTGGFSTRNLSVLGFDNVWIEVIITVFMFISGLHFGLIFLAVTGHMRTFLHSTIVKFYFFSTLIGIVFVACNLHWSEAAYAWPKALRLASFQVVSLCTTTGFATADTSIWPSFSVLVLFYFMFQCACAGSTSGGLKADRFLILFKSMQAQVRKLQHPNAVVPVRMNGATLESDVTAGVILYTATYIFIVFLVAVILTLLDLNIMDSFSASASCMANVGPGFGDSIGSLGNYSSMPFLAKALLSVEMLLGRLEIYGLLIFFFAKSWR